MIAKILETLTGKDDVERVAYRDDPLLLSNYLNTRKLFFPKRKMKAEVSVILPACLSPVVALL